MALKYGRLTRANLRGLQNGQSVAEHGIRVERTSHGDLRYSINIMVDGRRIHRVVGKESEGVTREKVERIIETIRTKAREDRLDLRPGRRSHRNFRKAAVGYLERLEQGNGKGLVDKRRHLTLHLVPYFGGESVDGITGFSVQLYARRRLEEGAKQATVNRELSTLSHMLRRAAEWGWIRTENVPVITKGVEPRKQIEVLSHDDQRALLRGAMLDYDPYCVIFVAFGLNTGMRHGEILRVRWCDINFSQRRINLPRAKAGQRSQPITRALVEILQSELDKREDKSGYVFAVKTADGRIGHRKTMTRQFERAVSRAGLDPRKVTPHVMRHTAITQLVKAGVDLPTIQRISGHKTLAMVMRYVHLSSEHIDSAIATLATDVTDMITPRLHARADGGDDYDGKAL